MRSPNYWHRRAEATGSYQDSVLADAELLHFHLLDDFVGALRELCTVRRRQTRVGFVRWHLRRDEWRGLGNALTGRDYSRAFATVSSRFAALQAVVAP